MAPMKAMKKIAEKKKKVEKDEESEDEEASSSNEEEEEEDESATEQSGEESSSEEDDDEAAKEEAKKEAEKEKQAGVRVEAGSAKREVDAQQRIISRLLKKQDVLLQKLKENKAAVRKAEKAMEPLKEVYSKKKRVFNRIKNEKQAIIDAKKASRMGKLRRSANKRLKFAKARVDAVNRGMRGVKTTHEDAKTALKRAQSKVDECNQTIKSLKAKGERIPENLKDDFSSPHSWKPPGYIAAKALMAAKEQLAKVQAVYDKAAGAFEKKDLKRKASQEKMEEVRNKRLGKGSSKDSLGSVATPAREASKSKVMKKRRL